MNVSASDRRLMEQTDAGRSIRFGYTQRRSGRARGAASARRRTAQWTPDSVRRSIAARWNSHSVAPSPQIAAIVSQ